MTDADPDADPNADARDFAHASVAGGNPTAWFDRLYAAAADGQAIVPWDRGTVHPMFLQWAEATDLRGRGSRAVIVGCGTGENAEYLSTHGFDTVAFDISPAAVQTAQRRFPQSRVGYLVANLLAPPAEWRHAFDLVVEIFTVQSLPPALHTLAIANTGLLVRPGGTLLVVSSAEDSPPELSAGPPWPLTHGEVTSFATDGVDLVRLDSVPSPADPSRHRWLAEFTRSSGHPPANDQSNGSAEPPFTRAKAGH